jgi:ATP-dependent exoDNAse (exonuclease V) beta subunit
LSIEQTDNTIEIMTIHKAKGLERDVVIIPFCKWEMTPLVAMRTIVWAKAQVKGEDKNDPVYSRVTEIGEFPVAYGNAMKDSAFAEEHCKELVMSHIDGLNMLYVAVTRAKKELYMFIEQESIAENKGVDLENISDTTPLILNAINNIEGIEVTTEKLDGTETITAKRYAFGNKIASITPKETHSGGISLTEYPSFASNITINHATRRFTDEAMQLGTEACTKGILLHKAFEGTSTKEDLYRSIEHLSANNEALANEAQQLRQHIDTAMQNEMIAEWFDGTWSDIKHEAEILRKGNRTHRPDRVMIKDNRVVVVDYKFGELKSTKYNKKVDKYMDLIREMGKYDTIEGYIWYVMLGEIERV